jgi:hypothetical protein
MLSILLVGQVEIKSEVICGIKGYVGETMSRWGAYQSGKGGQSASRKIKE